MPEPKGPQPRALIVTVYGLYARETAGWFGVATLIRLLARCGVDEQSVRSAIFRLKRRALLEPARVEGAAGYVLSATGRAILAEGDRRIFERRGARPGEGFVLAVFSVPETQRDRRHQLRSRLAWLGFGTVAAGVWIAPAHLEDAARDALARDGLGEYVELFRAEYVGTPDVAAWWDLDRLAVRYDEFLAVHAPLLRGYRRRGSVEPARAFADYVRALTAWRRLPYADPGLATSLLPRTWLGTRAADTFFELRDLLAGPAHEFVQAERGTDPSRLALKESS